jgi:nitrate/nitrite transport system ATP-binding protein
MCSEVGKSATAIMITNNLDEALLLSDQIVPMTRGPRSKLGTPIPVKLPRPRTAAQLLHDPLAVRTRAEVVERLAEFVHEGQRDPRNTTEIPKVARSAAVEEQL